MNRKHHYPQFDPKEQIPVRMKKAGMSGMFDNMHIPGMPKEEPVFDRPITEKENFRRMIAGENPCWMPVAGFTYSDVNPFEPREFPDNVAAHVVSDGLPDYEYDPADNNVVRSWFDLDWVYVPQAGGATVMPGKPLIEDMNDWEEIIRWPDLDAIDWEAMGRNNREYLDTPQLNEFHMACGFWERLISLMDVQGAAIALIDEDQQEAIHRFFDKYADFLIEIIRRTKAVCDIDAVLIHDDWGHQNAAFFSLETCREMIVPYMKRVIDYIHSEGMLYEVHACGMNETLVPALIEAGADFWCPQAINDTDMLAKKYPDSGFFYAVTEVPLSPFAPEEEAKAYARVWFDEHKDLPVFLGLMAPNPHFVQEIYRLSREYYRN